MDTKQYKTEFCRIFSELRILDKTGDRMFIVGNFAPIFIPLLSMNHTLLDKYCFSCDSNFNCIISTEENLRSFISEVLFQFLKEEDINLLLKSLNIN